MADYVIVGAGSAGCVLANRLINKGFRVALLEAGGSDATNEVRIPAAFTKLFQTERDWNYRTVPQSALGERSLYWPRGKMLGGSSSINAQMWFPGVAADYDGWARTSGAGWSFEKFRPYLSRAMAPADGKGNAGISVEALRDPNPATLAFLRACSEEKQPRITAFDVGSEGYTQTPVTQRRGARFSAADGYLRGVLKHPKLELVMHALARRILFEGRRAVGVEYEDSAGKVREVRAVREVIVSAGSINSPQLLMLSGIGDANELRKVGITPHIALSGVGKNLQDHVMTAVIADCPKKGTLVAAETLANLFRYLVLRRGMLTSNVGEAAAFVRTLPELRDPDIELIFAPVPFQDHGLTKPAGHGVTLGAVLLQPKSRGSITLTSNRPKDAPTIDPAYFTDAAGEDLATLTRGIDAAKRILQSSALREYVGKAVEPDRFDGDADSVHRFVREQAETLYHPVGTCRMGTDDASVVDPELRVRGADSLRVVDASIMPNIVRGHTHAPTVAIAEKAVDLLTGARAS
jgi:choline dehydrogenase